MSMTLHIERLVLDGLALSAGQSSILHAALEQELTRLLRERELPMLPGGAIPQLSVASIQLTETGHPAHWGRQIARSLCDGLAPVPAVSLRGRHVSSTSASMPPMGTPVPDFSSATTPKP
jgi:hypothetical protein